MELVTMYFWVVKLAFTAIVLYVCYVAFLKYKFKINCQDIIIIINWF